MTILTPSPRVTGALLVISAAVANGAFTGLSSFFDYPRVLQAPADRVLEQFTEQAVRVGALFTLLAMGAALLLPIALGTAALAGPGRWTRAAALTGVAAALVQAVGLARWPLLVPSLAATATDPTASPADRSTAVERFELANSVLGQIVGEAGGFLLTAAWTVLVLAALGQRHILPRWSTSLALVSAPMILAGLLVPLGVPGADAVNFVGYILWSGWIVALGVTLLRGGLTTRSAATAASAPTRHAVVAA